LMNSFKSSSFFFFFNFGSFWNRTCSLLLKSLSSFGHWDTHSHDFSTTMKWFLLNLFGFFLIFQDPKYRFCTPEAMHLFLLLNTLVLCVSSCMCVSCSTIFPFISTFTLLYSLLNCSIWTHKTENSVKPKEKYPSFLSPN
jgi:hypothetical protein